MKKNTLWSILFEFLSIMFAVLLALGLNSYKENQDLKYESEILTSKILKESEANLELISSVVIQNSAFIEYLDSLKKEENANSFDISIDNELLSSVNWTITKTSPSFHYMDSDFLEEAAKLYELQNHYVEISSQMFQNLGNMMIQMDNSNTKKFIRVTSYYVSNILYTARELEKSYNIFLDHHRER